jgi:uncharacterized protein
VVEITVTNLAQLGKIVDSCVQAGANRIEGVSFELKNEREAHIRALRAAVEDARAKAEAIAKELGVSLTGVQQASEGGGRVIPLARTMTFERAAGSAATPVVAGQIQVTASVNITYDLSPLAGTSK